MDAESKLIAGLFVALFAVVFIWVAPEPPNSNPWYLAFLKALITASMVSLVIYYLRHK